MKYLKPYIRKFAMESVLAPLFKMLEAFFDLLVPMVVARIIDQGIPSGDGGYILGQCLILVGMAVLGLLCSYTAQYFAARAAVGTAAGLRRDLYARVNGMSCSVLDTVGTSTLITRLTSDINLVQNGVNMFLRLFLRSPFIVVGAVVMALRIDSSVGLVFIAGVAVLSGIVGTVMMKTAPMYRNIQGGLDSVTRDARENLTGVRVVRAFGREEAEKDAFSRDNTALFKAQNLAGRVSALMNPLTYAVVNLCIIAILYIGAGKVDAGVMASGSVVALVNYMSQILVELVKLANLIVLISRAWAGLGRVSQVMDIDITVPMTPAGPAREGEAVSFEDVSVNYGGADNSLEGITFTVRRGETVGVIGSTGSGKTTLVNLIPRLYDASGGTVRLFGRDVTSIPTEELRRTVAVVPQKSQLFRGTVRSNLRWGREDAGDEEMWQALRDAQAEEFVLQKGEGLDAPVEQGGRNLSGGQRQRLTIARALLAGAKVLILDDASSALDYATDLKLRRALAKLKDTTVFLVSQRTGSLRDADRILVLDDGKLVGQGKHETLLETCPVYRQIHESQYRRGEDEKKSEE